MNRAPVTVIIPAFNSAPYLERAIRSVEGQSVPVSSIIVVDDCSTDNTPELVRQLAETCPFLKLISLDRNSGPSVARNIAIDASTTEWVALLDADDAWKPRRIECLYKLAVDYRADFVADNQILYDLVARVEIKEGLSVDWTHQTIDAETLFRNDLIEKSPLIYGLLKPMMRKTFLVKHNIKYIEDLRSGEDFILYADMIFSGAHAVLTSEAHYIYSTRVGFKSNTASPASRTKPRFDLAIEAQDSITKKYDSLITNDVRSAMMARRRRLDLIHRSNVARDIRRLGYLKFIAYLCANPALVPLYGERSIRRIKRKLERRWY